MPCKLFPLSSLQNLKGRLKLFTSQSCVIERLKVTCCDNQVKGNAGLGKDQWTMHEWIELALIEFARVFWNYYWAIGANVIRTYRTTSAKYTLNISVGQKVFLNIMCHLLQAHKVRISLFNNLKDWVKSFFSLLIKPHIVGEDLDFRLLSLCRYLEILHLQSGLPCIQAV